jgi:hypothetical protein
MKPAVDSLPAPCRCATAAGTGRPSRLHCRHSKRQHPRPWIRCDLLREGLFGRDMWIEKQLPSEDFGIRCLFGPGFLRAPRRAAPLSHRQGVRARGVVLCESQIRAHVLLLGKSTEGERQ